ncbi:MAG: MFS transporter [Gammaproteobacteria bacterium]|nr:MFS transporter [Gammaproteobacteria bacterium]
MYNPAVALSFYYFVLFLGMGSVIPFFPVWLQSIQFNEHQISIIAASPAMALVVITWFVGNVADRARDWRSTLVIMYYLAAVLMTGLFWTRQFHAVLILWTVSVALQMALSPVLDAASIRMARQRNIAFHRIRAFGSIGFIVGALLAGFIFDALGIEKFLWVLVTLGWLRAILGHTLPKFRAGIERTKPAADSSDYQRLREPWFVLVLLGSALIQGSHAYYYTFGSVMWLQAGFSESLVSMLWALGVMVEILVMWMFSSLARQFSARKLLIVAGLVACVRWAVFGLDPTFPLLVAAQALHGLTFAILFLATVNFIANWTSTDIAATAQSVSSAMNTAMLSGVTLLSGAVHLLLGVTGYWLMMMMCVAGVLAILAGLWWVAPQETRTSAPD